MLPPIPEGRGVAVVDARRKTSHAAPARVNVCWSSTDGRPSLSAENTGSGR